MMQVVEANGSRNMLIDAPFAPQVLQQVFGPKPIGGIVWDFHHYQMESHCVMRALSYWCMVNALRCRTVCFT